MGAAFAEGMAGPAQIWIDGRRVRPRPSVVLPSSARTRKRENHSGGERGLSLSRPPRAIAEGVRGRRAAAAMPCSCSGMDMEWTLMNNCRDARPFDRDRHCDGNTNLTSRGLVGVGDGRARPHYYVSRRSKHAEFFKTLSSKI